MKYLALILILALCVPTVWADDPQPNTENEKAKEMKADVKTFADTYLKTGDSYLTDLIGKVDQALAELAGDADRNQFHPQEYMEGVTDKVKSMLDKIETYEKKGTCKDDYLKEVSDSFVTEYAKDLNADVKNITTDNYLNDLDGVANSYENKLDDMNKPASSDATTEYNPAEHLDKSALGKVVKPVQIDFSWAGVNDHWLNYQLVDLMKQFKNKGFDSKAKKDFYWISQVWAQGIETGGMEQAAYQNPYLSDSDKQVGKGAQSYYLNQYGKLMTDEADKAAVADQVKPLETYTKGDGTYNNRSYNYKYNYGQYGYYTNTTIKIKTGGREYNLQETVYTSPIVLDMDGDGRLEASNGKWLPHAAPEGIVAEFDMDGDSFVDVTEWVGPNDGILLVYNGQDVDANSLFGDANGYFHGYEKLSLLDENNDQQISGNELKTLSVWQDKNGDAKVDKGEIASVESLGITSISLSHDSQLVSSFVQNGVSKKVWDWYPTMLKVQRKK